LINTLKKMKYSNIETSNYLQFIGSKYKIKIDESCNPSLQVIFKNEGGKGSFQASERIVSLDCIETKIAKKIKSNKGSTMDMAFIVAQNKKKKLLFTDFKLRVKPNLSSIKKTDILKKLSNSKSRYRLNYELCNDVYFVFNKNITKQAQSRLKYLFGAKTQNTSISIHDFYNLLFD